MVVFRRSWPSSTPVECENKFFLLYNKPRRVGANAFASTHPLGETSNQNGSSAARNRMEKMRRVLKADIFKPSSSVQTSFPLTPSGVDEKPFALFFDAHQSIQDLVLRLA